MTLRTNTWLGLFLAIAICVPSFAEDQYTTLWPGNAAIGGYLALPTGIEINSVTIEIAPGVGQDGYSLVYSASSGLIGLVSVAGGAGGAFWSGIEGGGIYRDSDVIFGGDTAAWAPGGQVVQVSPAFCIVDATGNVLMQAGGDETQVTINRQLGIDGGLVLQEESMLAIEYDSTEWTINMLDDTGYGAYAQPLVYLVSAADYLYGYVVPVVPVTDVAAANDDDLFTWNSTGLYGEWQSIPDVLIDNANTGYIVYYDETDEKFTSSPFYTNLGKVAFNSGSCAWGSFSIYDDYWDTISGTDDYANLVIYATNTAAAGTGGRIGVGYVHTDGTSWIVGGALQALRDDASSNLGGLGFYSRTGSGLDWGMSLDSESNAQIVGYVSSAQGFISSGTATLGSAAIDSATFLVANASSVILSSDWDSEIEMIYNTGAMTATPSWITPGAMVYDAVHHPTRAFFYLGQGAWNIDPTSATNTWGYMNISVVPQGGF